MPRKLATLQVISNELIADSNPDVVSLLELQVARSLALTFDDACFEGSGTAPEIRGLKNVVGITLDATLSAAPTNLDVFANAITTLETNNAKATAIVMHPRTWGTLSKIKEATSFGTNKPLCRTVPAARARRWSGASTACRCFSASQLSLVEGTAESSAYVYDTSQVIAVFRQDTTITLDRSRLFNSDQSELRAILRADSIVPNPLAVVRILEVHRVRRMPEPGSDYFGFPVPTGLSMSNPFRRWWERRSLATPSHEMLTLSSTGPTESGVTVSPETALNVPAVYSLHSGARAGCRARDVEVAAQDRRRYNTSMRPSTACMKFSRSLANAETTAYSFKLQMTAWNCSPMSAPMRRLCGRMAG